MNSRIEKIIPLGDSQMSVWMSIVSGRESKNYVELISVKVYGKELYDRGILEKSIAILSEEIAALRCVIVWKKTKMPNIIVFRQSYKNCTCVDCASNFNQKSYNKFIEDIWKKKVSIDQTPFYFYIVKESETCSHVIMKFSHILIDGWSTTIILEELYTIILHFIHNKTYIPRKKDYGNDSILKKISEQNFLFWKQYLQGCDKFDLSVNEGNVGFWNSHFICQSHLFSRFSLAVYIYASWILTDYIWGKNRNIQFGVIVSGRELNTELLGRVGFYMKTLPFFVSLDLNWTVREFLSKVNEIFLNIIAHSDINTSEVFKINNYKHVYEKVIVIQNYFGTVLNFKNEELKFVLEEKKYDNDINFCLAARIFGRDVFLDVNYNQNSYTEKKLREITDIMQSVFSIITNCSKFEEKRLLDIMEH